MDDASVQPDTPAKPLRPLDAFERRVLGVLIEKGKTTPDQYPLSLNGLVTGCNQKSNRDPLMTLDEEQVMRAVKGLRECGAMAEVYGSGKLPRYRHLAYEWLGVGKEELAIMGELLLRGEQTEGDLRGRASRMDPIPDLDALRLHLDRLAAKGLVIWLSPPGRGRMLTHGLLPQEKLDKVRAELGMAAAAAAAQTPAHTAVPSRAESSAEPEEAPRAAAPPPPELEARIAGLEREIATLRERLVKLEDALGG
ncbi:MAG: YceH family protein [Planctomycetia bacterium]|nr:YceH family protein [Planctomycetia bacterium]